MRRSALFLAFGLATTTQGFARRRVGEESWKPAKATAVYEQQFGAGWSPKPTEAPHPPLGMMDLERRLDGYTLGPGTCGYVSSNGNSYICYNTDATCKYEGDYVGCCLPNQDCELVQTTCLDFEASKSGACDLLDDQHTLCCGAQTRGACYTWLFSSTMGPNNALESYTFLECSALEGTGTLLDYDPAWSETHSFESTETTSTSSEEETTTSESETETSASSTSTSTGGPGGNSDGTDRDNNDSGGSDGGGSSNVGAIAGGTVGGVAALGLVGAAAFLLIRRRKKNANDPNKHSPAMTGIHPGPPGPHSPPPPTMSPGSPGTYQYSSGYAPSSVGQSYDPRASAAYSHGGYPQQYQNFQHDQGYNNQYPPQQGLHPNQGYNGEGYYPVSTASPPPHTTPSPGVHNNVAHTPPQNGAQELGTNNPVGMSTNRAELN